MESIINQVLEETKEQRRRISETIGEKWEMINLLTLALTYVEEVEEFNHPEKRKLSVKIKEILKKYN